MSTGELSLVLAITMAVVTGVAYFIQNRARKDAFFKECAKSLYSSNLTEQITAAILLRSYVNSLGYSARTKNIMVALLRTSIPVTLQKVVADVFSYAKNMDGHDMQCINMLGALIKPESRIKYELTHDRKYKRKRLSMRQADFYHAILKDCNISNVDATKAVFYCANLSGTSFRNCLFHEANFRGVNIKNVTFDEDCELVGANFEGAIGLETASIKVRVSKEEVKRYSLIDFLDADGIFQAQRTSGQYQPRKNDVAIFVSKLGAMDAVQKSHFKGITDILNDCEGTSLIQIEREQYPVVSQLSDVLAHLENCDGCVIFAFEYMQIASGWIHKDIESDDRKELHEVSVVSPWLHIEAALANCNNIPCLVIYDKDLYRDGMFEEKIVTPDRGVFALEYSDLIDAENSTLQAWMNSVREHRLGKKS